MAFETGTASGPEDLISKLETFITSVSPSFTIERSATSVSPFDLAVSDSGGLNCQITANGQVDRLYIHGSTGFDGSGAGSEPGASAQSNSVTNGHQVSDMTGPYEAYWFYMNVDPSVGPLYFHAVVEIVAGTFRHFGFGNIEKFGTFEGGQYYNGHFWQTGSLSDDPNSTSHRISFDGIGTTGYTNRCFMHIEQDTLQGWNGPLLSPTVKWFVPGNGSGGSDGDGVINGYIEWTSRHAWYLHPFYECGGSSQFNGFKPLIPIACFLEDLSPLPDELYFIGYAPDVREISMEGIIPGQALVVGGDTWDCYPMGRKNLLQDNTEGTENWGRAYRRRV